MSNITVLKKKVDRLASLVPQQTIRDHDFEERLTHLSPRQMAREGAQLGLDALLELMGKRQGRMSLDDLLMASKAATLYNDIIRSTPITEKDEEAQEDLSGFTDDELRRYAELQERARKKT